MFMSDLTVLLDSLSVVVYVSDGRLKINLISDKLLKLSYS